MARHKKCALCGKDVDPWCSGGSVTDPGHPPDGILTTKSQYEKVYHIECYNEIIENKKSKKK